MDTFWFLFSISFLNLFKAFLDAKGVFMSIVVGTYEEYASREKYDRSEISNGLEWTLKINSIIS